MSTSALDLSAVSVSGLAPVVVPSVAAPAARVLHLINGEHYSGAERVQDLLAGALPEFGYAVDFACLKPGRFAHCLQSSATVYDASMRSRVDLRAAARVAELIQRQGYRLLHTHTPRAALIGRWASQRAGVPMVHHVHSPTAADSSRWIRNHVNAAIERFSLGQISGVIAVSHSLGEYARQQGISAKLIHVVPNGVPVLGPLVPRATPTGTWTLATVALFRPRKGLEVLLEALALLIERGLPVRLKAVGGFETAEYETHIWAEVRRLGLESHIQRTGFTQNVPAELASSDLFVLPSLYGEGLPMVVLEAMAAGVPVVATRVEGIPEAIRADLDGLICEAGSPQSLAAAISRYVEGKADWQAIRASAHRRQQDKFSNYTMAQGVAQVYQQVLA